MKPTEQQNGQSGRISTTSGGSKPKDTKSVHRWLELTAEADYWAWIIETMYEKSGQRSPIERMIDDSTGHTQALLKEARYAISQFKRCQKELTQLDQGNDLVATDREASNV